MIYIYFLIFIAGIFSSEKQLYLTIQMMDQVMAVDPFTLQIDESISTEFGGAMDMQNCMDYSMEMDCSMADGCEWMMGMCMESTNDDTMNTPHFIVLDEVNGYWFVTTIASGYIAQFSLLDNMLIDTYFVGDAPALMSVDPKNKIVYCSRMMPMNGMGNMMPSSESNIIQAISYSSMGLSEIENGEYEIGSPAPHGLTISDDGQEIFTASNTADWLYKIEVETGEVTGVPLDGDVSNAPDQTTQRLKPIQCLFVNDKIFVTCSAGPWYNPFTGESEIISGKLQMWDSINMVLLDSIELGDYSSPWHIASSPIDEVVYVALGGDNLYDTEGLAAVRFENNLLSLEWSISDSSFDTLHGIDVSNDGQTIYVSGRGDGYVHVFDNEGNYIDNLFLGTMSMLGGIAIEKKGTPNLGDLNNDNFINIYDIVIIIENIFDQMMDSPYHQYSGNLNEDDDIDIIDIVLLVDLALSI